MEKKYADFFKHKNKRFRPIKSDFFGFVYYINLEDICKTLDILPHVPIKIFKPRNNILYL